MKPRIVMAALASLALVAFCSDAEAGPFRRRSSGGATVSRCGPGGCQVSSVDTSTAQGVAEAMARHCSMQHMGNPTGTAEGVGMSSSGPEDAIRRCCFHPENGKRDRKIAIIDQGVARGRDGNWYACIRGH